MKHKFKIILLLSITLCLAFTSLLLINYRILNSDINNNKTEFKTKVETKVKTNTFDKLKQSYNNNDIVAFIEIPNVLIEPVVQTSDNDYYLNYNINHEKDINGAIFLDYRLNIIDNKKILIYGHSDPKLTLPFAKLAKYHDKEFFKENPIINLYTKEKNYKFNIFSSYVEVDDFDYINIKNFNGLSWLDHLQKLKNKSEYETGINVSDNKKVIILQTCSFEKNIKVINKNIV